MRVWLLLLLLVLAGNASAALSYDDEGKAYAACQTGKAALLAAYPGAVVNSPGWDCSVRTSSTNRRCQYYTGQVRGCGYYVGGASTLESDFNWPSGQTCATRALETTWQYNASTGGDQPKCYEGCKYTGALDAGSPTGASFGATGDLCIAGSFPSPTFDDDGDGVPNDDDAFPDDPNESADTDGDGIGDNADFAPEDPTDGIDEPGEEDGDDEGDNEAHGGGDCNAPPTCSGDGIQCAQLFQQWRTACATEALASEGIPGGGGDGEVPGDANGNGQPDWTEGAAPTGPDEGGEDDVTEWGLGVSTDLLDEENIFGAGSCPSFDPISIMGVEFDPAEFTWWCTLVSILRGLILIFGALTAIRILLGD